MPIERADQTIQNIKSRRIGLLSKPTGRDDRDAIDVAPAPLILP